LPSVALLPYTTLFRSRGRLLGNRDALPDPEHAGGRPRLRGPRAPLPRRVLRAAAEPAALQADAPGSRRGEVLPDRPLLPRRGLRSEEHTSELQSPYDR